MRRKMAVPGIDQIGDLPHGLFGNREGMRRRLETVVNVGMREQATAHVGADEHERSQSSRGYRNGSKPRKFKTRLGELELSVPQVRNCEPHPPSLFARRQRSERALLVACGGMYFQGVSTRNVRKVLDEKLSAFRQRRIGHSAWQ